MKNLKIGDKVVVDHGYAWNSYRIFTVSKETAKKFYLTDNNTVLKVDKSDLSFAKERKNNSTYYHSIVGKRSKLTEDEKNWNIDQMYYY